jgi:transposase-like protein
LSAVDPRAHADRTAAEFGLPPRATCPFCSGDDTELHSPFGSVASVVTYWCHRCHTAFERFKREKPPLRPT